MQRALIGLHHRKPGISHVARLLRLVEKALHGGGQRCCIIDLLQRTGLAQQGGDLEEVEQVRAAEHRHGQRRRLQQVVPAVGHQAAANESDVSQRIEKQQFPHGIAHQHRNIRCDSLRG